MRQTLPFVLASILALVGCGDDPPALTGGAAGQGLVINEIAAAGSPFDWFELLNTSGQTLDLSGFSFTDNLDTRNNVSDFPDGTTIGPGEHLVIQFNEDFPGFFLNGTEELGIIAPDGQFIDTVVWDEGDSPVGGSYARIPDGTGPFETLGMDTRGASNQR